MKKTYTALCTCSNCHVSQEIVIIVGKPIKNVTCPNCGVQMLSGTIAYTR